MAARLTSTSPTEFIQLIPGKKGDREYRLVLLENGDICLFGKNEKGEFYSYPNTIFRWEDRELEVQQMKYSQVRGVLERLWGLRTP